MSLTHIPGMQFDLGEDIAMLRETLQQFVASEITPRAAEIDRSDQFPMDLWRKLGELGVHGLTVSEEFGGTDLGYLAHIVAMEEISRGSASVGLSYGAHSNLCVNQIHRNGTPRAEGALPAGPDLRRIRRRAGHVRAQRRLRRRFDEAAGGLQGRPLDAQRQQDVDHQRPGCRCHGDLRQERRPGRAARHHRLPRREGFQGLQGGPEARQARHARQPHRRAGVRGLRSPRRQHSRRHRRRPADRRRVAASTC